MKVFVVTAVAALAVAAPLEVSAHSSTNLSSSIVPINVSAPAHFPGTIVNPAPIQHPGTGINHFPGTIVNPAPIQHPGTGIKGK